jgi:hypothetical protein
MLVLQICIDEKRGNRASPRQSAPLFFSAFLHTFEIGEEGEGERERERERKRRKNKEERRKKFLQIKK